MPWDMERWADALDAFTCSTYDREILMCGFTDVRQRLDGTYYCTMCGKELGKDFDLAVAIRCGKRASLQLSRQCSPQPQESGR